MSNAGTKEDPILRDFTWVEEAADGTLTHYVNRTGGGEGGSLAEYMPLKGGSFTGDIHLVDHTQSYETMASSIAINKADFERKSLKVLKVSSMPETVRPNTLYLVVVPSGDGGMTGD